MKNRKGFVLNKRGALAAGALTLALIFTGCSTDSEDTPGTIVLPDIEEPTTGQTTIELTDVALQGDSIPDIEQTGNGNGVTWSVTNNKLRLKLETPASLDGTFSSYNGDAQTDFFGRTDEGHELTISSDTAEYYRIGSLSYSQGQYSYSISREIEDTDNKTYGNFSRIYYFYVDADVTITRTAQTFEVTENYDEPYPTEHWSAVNLPLKRGWNLVQLDEQIRLQNGNLEGDFAIKIADKNVPWTVEARDINQ